MHCDMSMYIGTFGHLLLRSLLSIRDRRAGLVPDAISRILWGTFGHNRQPLAKAKIFSGAANVQLRPYGVP